MLPNTLNPPPDKRQALPLATVIVTREVNSYRLRIRAASDIEFAAHLANFEFLVPWAEREWDEEKRNWIITLEAEDELRLFLAGVAVDGARIEWRQKMEAEP